MSTEGRRIGRDLGAQLALRIVNLGLGVVAVALLARSLGLEGMGEWTVLVTLMGIVGEFTELGLEGLAVRRSAGHPEREPAILGTFIALRGLLVLPTFLIGGGIGVAIATSGDMRMAAVVSAATVISSVPSSLRTVYQLRLRNDVPQLVGVLNSVLWTGTLFVLSQVGVSSLFWFALALLTIQILTSLVQAFLGLRRVRPDFSQVREQGRDMLRVGVVLGFGALVVGAYARIDQILVLRVDGPEGAGVYGTAVGTFSRLGVVPMTLMATMTPLLAAAAKRSREDLQRTARLAIRLMTVAALGLIVVSAAAGGPIVALLYGPEFDAVVTILPFVALNFAIGMMGYITTTLVLIHERQRRQLVVALIGLAVNVPLNLVIIPIYDYYGALAVATLTELVVLGLITWNVRASLPPLSALAGPWLRTAVAAGLTAAATWGAVRLGLPLVPVLLIAGGVYAVSLAATGAVTRDELAALRGGGDDGDDDDEGPGDDAGGAPPATVAPA